MLLNGLDLFSGIGGIGLALSEYVRTVAYCESDRYAQSVLLSRMRSGDIDKAPIWDDVRTLKGSMLPKIDIIFGGFPCQDISVAGTRKGLEGQRSGLFFEVLRLVEEIKPSFVFLENVPGIRTKGLSVVCYELADMGYDIRWTIVSAGELGACHLRKRWFLLGHINRFNSESPQPKNQNTNTNSNGVHKKQEPVNGIKDSLLSLRTSNKRFAVWSPERFVEPRVGRTGDGVPNRMDKHRCLGNSVVPIAAKTAFERLIGFNVVK